MNSSEDINNLVRYIEELACHLNPGPVAVKVGEHLNENYILINKDTLPEINHGTLDDAFGGFGLARLEFITEQTFNGDTAKMRSIALEYLSMAEYLDNRAKTAEENVLKTARYDAYMVLFPNSDMTLDEFDFTSPGISQSNKNAITEIVNLKAQLAEKTKIR